MQLKILSLLFKEWILIAIQRIKCTLTNTFYPLDSDLSIPDNDMRSLKNWDLAYEQILLVCFITVFLPKRVVHTWEVNNVYVAAWNHDGVFIAGT